MILDLWNRFLRPIFTRITMKIAEKKEDKCSLCNGSMEIIQSYLCLIPVYLDDEHEESADYYLKNAKRIDDMEKIPNGNRSCYMHIMQCKNCGHKEVGIIDFLKVREDILLKGAEIYPYEKFQHFFEEM